MSDSPSLWLSEDELIEFTGYQWRAKQQMALAQMGIRFNVNPRGRVLVLRVDVGLDKPKPRPRKEPNWGRVGRKSCEVGGAGEGAS